MFVRGAQYGSRTDTDHRACSTATDDFGGTGTAARHSTTSSELLTVALWRHHNRAAGDRHLGQGQRRLWLGRHFRRWRVQDGRPEPRNRGHDRSRPLSAPAAVPCTRDNPDRRGERENVVKLILDSPSPWLNCRMAVMAVVATNPHSTSDSIIYGVILAFFR